MSKDKERKKIPLDIIVSTVSAEKGVDQDAIFDALNVALVSATKKKYGNDIDVRVSIDSDGHYETFRRWEVVEDPLPNHPLEFPRAQITLSAAQLDEPEIKPGDYVEEQIESISFGRIATQAARQAIIQELKKAEKIIVISKYKELLNQIVNGQVKRVYREGILVDLGNNADALLPRNQILPRESFRIGDRVRAVLMEVIPEVSKGPQLILSRTSQEMLVALFKIEVPEVGEGIIEIKGAARDPGVRAKIAVKTNDKRLDPVGACVGMRGTRVQTISNELGGERVDIILWDESPAQFVMNSMAPAEIVSIVVDEDTNVMDIAVKQEFLSQAIGRAGQNVRLASELTGWSLNVMSDEDAEAQKAAETQDVRSLFIDKLGVDEEVADILVDEGFLTLEEIAYVPIQEMLEIEEFDEDIVNSLRARAKDVLLTQAIAEEEHQEPSKDLLGVEGINKELAMVLAKNKIVTRDDLAELSIDDLLKITEIDSDTAGKLIMAARAHWFVNEDQQAL